MKNFKYTVLLTFLMLVSFSSGIYSQSLNNLSHNDLYSGFMKAIAGDTLKYPSGNPLVEEAVIARCTEDRNEVEWLTENIPLKYNDDTIYFVWYAGFATGKNRKKSNFDFLINDKQILTIPIEPLKASNDWVLKGSDGIELSYVESTLDDNKDTFGYMYLKLPVKNYSKGQPLKLKIAAKDSRRNNDWYMTFLHPINKKRVTIYAPPLLRKNTEGMLEQLISVNIEQIVPVKVQAELSSNTGLKKNVELELGNTIVELWVSAVNAVKDISIDIEVPKILSQKENVVLRPVTQREVYLINHSHTDIGYSDYQTVVIKKQNDYIYQAMDLIEKTKEFPEEARFIWNIEALWVVENFMNEATEEEKKKFIEYVKNGSIGLSSGYINLLTGISRPEELIHWTDYSRKLKKEFGIESKSLMISDVPGMNWSVVPALSQAGVRYVSSGPNYIPQPGFPDTGARVGSTHRAWGDKPFYWTSASKKDTIMYWQAGRGYSFFHNWNSGKLRFKPKPINALLNYMQELQDENYPYSIVQARYSIVNDNSKPDEELSAVVAEWNRKYVSPRLIISTTDNMMTTFEDKYKDEIPVATGDFSPYWPDGVMSTAKEEVMTKQSVERLYQSEVLNTLFYPDNYDDDAYYNVWRRALMWHEHTWGHSRSIVYPDDENVIKMWKYKQRFALTTDSLSRKLLDKSLDTIFDKKRFDVINTSSWTRTDLVFLNKEQSSNGDIIVDDKGTVYPSQRLSDGKLAFLAKDIPSLGSKRFYNKRGKAAYKSSLDISEKSMSNDVIKLRLDEKTGAIESLIDLTSNHEFVDKTEYQGLNQYLYMLGKDPSKATTADNVQITIKDQGPLLSTFQVMSKAPGTEQLVQEITLIDQLNKVAIKNMVNKTKVREKESVHFAFPIKMINGQMRIDIGTGNIRPEVDQLTGANKDYISMQRWVDVSDNSKGLTFISNEVPLMEQGEMINETPVANSGDFGGISEEKHWKHYSKLSNTFFSYVMNNYWYTNYKADQEGPVTFNYSLYLHDRFDPAEADRKARANGQPLLVTASVPQKGQLKLPISIDDKNIVLNGLRPTRDRKGVIMRFYNASANNQTLNFQYLNGADKIYLSNANGDKLEPFDPQQVWAPYELISLYMEL